MRLGLAGGGTEAETWRRGALGREMSQHDVFEVGRRDGEQLGGESRGKGIVRHIDERRLSLACAGAFPACVPFTYTGVAAGKACELSVLSGGADDEKRACL